MRAKVAREGQFDRNVEKPLVFEDSARARGQIFQIFWLESRIISYVLLKCDVEMVEITICLEGFRHARAAGARMWPAWYYLTGMAPLASARKLLS